MKKISIASLDIVWLFVLISIFVKSLVLLTYIDSFIFLTSASIPYYFCFIAFLLSFAFLFKKRARGWFLLCFDLFLTFIMLADLWYYRGGYGTFLNLHILQETANLQNLGDCVQSFIYPQDFLLAVDLPILLLLICSKKFSVLFKQERSILLFTLFFLFSAVYISYVPFNYYVFGKQDSRMQIFQICWAPKQTIANLSPIGFHVYDAFNYWKECQPLPLTPEETTAIKQWFVDKQENLPDNHYQGIFKGKNLLLIQVESLENIVIGNKVNNQEITPTLNRLLEESLYFSNIYEQVFNGTSSDSDFMVNTSVYPVRKGSTFFRFPKNTYNSLPKLLEQNGYQTISLHGIAGGFWNWMESHYGIGFQKCVDKSSFNLDEVIGLGISDGSYLRQVVPMLEELAQPFYAFTVTMSNHGPFNLPARFRELDLAPELDQTKLGGYFQGLHYTDQQIGIFLATLEEKGLLDNTVVVIYGDHGGMNKFYKDEAKTTTIPESWWEPQEYNRIPLLIYCKGMKGEEIKTLGGQIDIMPTLTYLMGIEEKKIAYTAMGRNLLKTKKNFVVLSYGDVLGTFANEEEKNKAVKGLMEIADQIIRSNYFGKYYTE